MARLAKALDAVVSAAAVLGAALLLFITFSISYSILTRALGWYAPIWIVQFNEYALLWITFLSSAWVLRRGGHVSIDLLTRRLPAAGQRGFSVLQRALGVGVAGVLAFYSGMGAWDHYRRNVMDVQAVDVPKALILAVIPIGFLLLAAQFLRGTSEGEG